MSTLLLLWASQTGGTLALAEAFAAGAAREPGTRLRCLPAAQAGPEDALEAALLVFATPEYLAAMSGLMKDWFDRSYYALADRLAGRPYATMVCAGSDGTGATRQIDRIATGLRLRRVAEPLIVDVGASSPERILARKRVDPAALARCEDLGATLAAGLALGLF